jgi:hypothetical protein
MTSVLMGKTPVYIHRFTLNRNITISHRTLNDIPYWFWSSFASGLSSHFKAPVHLGPNPERYNGQPFESNSPYEHLFPLRKFTTAA